jgi:AGZA family xanthine/uracil permease-like MFS transporter
MSTTTKAAPPSSTYPIFVKRDLDGFFGLFIDNLVQLLLIIQLCAVFCGMSEENNQSALLFKTILPGAAISILFGNILYAMQAHRLAKKEGRSDVTALPYGINTPSLLVFIFFVMLPDYLQHKDPVHAWKMGLIACLGSGIIEFIGSFFAGIIRKKTPRAALLSTLAGIAIGFISMKFAIEIYEKPLISLIPMAIVLVAFFSQVKMPLGIPGGFIAVLVGTLISWGLTGVLTMGYTLPTWLANQTMDPNMISVGWAHAGWSPPVFVGGLIWQELLELFKNPNHLVGMLTVVIPMGVFNVVGSMQNIESSEAAGDKYWTMPSMLINSIGTIIGALFGSCFPTTIYIGHPGWKAMGARAGYSTLNGLVISIICLTGVVGVINRIVPMEAGNAIVLWIGIVITAQAFQATPKRHAPAVAVGLFPAIAAWGATVMKGAFIVAGGATMQAILEKSTTADVNGFLILGLLSMESGYILTCMLTSAMVACLIDRRFLSAMVWAYCGAVFALLGMTHAIQIKGNLVDYLFIGTEPMEGAIAYPALGISISYVICGLIFLLMRNAPVTDVSHTSTKELQA